MAVKKLELPEIGAVKLYKRKGARAIKLSVTSTGEVRVSLPYWLPFDAGMKFALSKQAWILKQIQDQSLNPIVHGQSIGKSHHVYFIATPEVSRISARIEGNAIRITHPIFSHASDTEVQKAAESACVRALRAQAEALLPQRLRTLASMYQFSYRSTSIKRLRGRWGSCDAEHNIVLNLFLMQLPWQLIDYVLLHELTHTKVLHHGSDFWQEFEQHLPHAKKLRRAIRTYRPIVASTPNL